MPTPTSPKISRAVSQRLSIKSDVNDANFPKDGQGRTYHTFTKEGEIANRVVTVGSHNRAALIAGLFDKLEEHVISDRGFITYTGTLRGTRVSVIATGMGLPMVDMMVREVNACVPGPLLFLRLGTCGTPAKHVKLGAVAVSKQCVLVTRNYDAFHNTRSRFEDCKSNMMNRYYNISTPIKASRELTHSLTRELQKRIDHQPVNVGTGATCDSFYGSQGRTDPFFHDHNKNLINDLMKKHPDTVSLEMETGHLLHLAATSTDNMIRAGGCAIVLAQRQSNNFLSLEMKKAMERECGIAVLEALITTKLARDDKTYAKPLSKDELNEKYGTYKTPEKEKAMGDIQSKYMYAKYSNSIVGMTFALGVAIPAAAYLVYRCLFSSSKSRE